MPDELTIDPARMTVHDWARLKRYLDDAAAAVHPDLVMAICHPLDAHRSAIMPTAARMNSPHRTSRQPSPAAVFAASRAALRRTMPTASFTASVPNASD